MHEPSAEQSSNTIVMLLVVSTHEIAAVALVHPLHKSVPTMMQYWYLSMFSG